MSQSSTRRSSPSPPAVSGSGRARTRRIVQLAVVALIVAGLGAIFATWGSFLWDLLTDQDRFKAWIDSYGVYAAPVFVAAQFVQVVLFFIPGEVIQIAGGYIFGSWLGLILSYLGITLGSLTAFAIARMFEQATLDFLVDRETVRRFDRIVYGRSGFWPMFVLFLIPGVPKDLLCYVAGLTPMHVVTFLAISTIGRFPGVLLSSLFGGGLAERDWEVTVISGVVALGLVALVYAARKPLDRFRQRHLVTRDEVALLGTSGGPSGGMAAERGSVDDPSRPERHRRGDDRSGGRDAGE